MNISPPKVILRLGSHAEKDYFEKLSKSLDGIIFGANLLEITPAATCSLILALNIKRIGNTLPFYLDPMTYCFGPYVDPATGRPQNNLEGLKSERFEKRGAPKKIKAVKDSYLSLASNLGSVFRRAVNDGKTCNAIDPLNISSAEMDVLCQDVIEYQIKRLNEILSSDELMKSEFSGDVRPTALFAPYFFIQNNMAKEGLNAMFKCITRTVALKPPSPVHAVVCADSSILSDSALVDYLIQKLSETDVSGVWFWFDGFDELQAPLDHLVAFRKIVCSLKGKMQIFNLHGGYYSLLLAHDGLTGISHGVGYGEQKTISPVIGVAAPTVRYYLPPISKRIGVPDIQRCFAEIACNNANDFFLKICDCQICKGVIGTDLDRFASFGEMHRANEESMRDTQTPAAAKMCRFHFLINRFKERKTIANLDAKSRAQHVMDNASPWRNLDPLQRHVGPQGQDGYLEFWKKSLEWKC